MSTRGKDLAVTHCLQNSCRNQLVLTAIRQESRCRHPKPKHPSNVMNNGAFSAKIFVRVPRPFHYYYQRTILDKSIQKDVTLILKKASLLMECIANHWHAVWMWCYNTYAQRNDEWFVPRDSSLGSHLDVCNTVLQDVKLAFEIVELDLENTDLVQAVTVLYLTFWQSALLYLNLLIQQSKFVISTDQLSPCIQ